MPDALHTVTLFAKALDAEDYAAAEVLLADECEYACRGQEFHGATAIVQSYRANGTAAKVFDSIEYDSDVVADTDATYRIRFSDHLTHAGRQMCFQCEQVIELDASGRIVRIQHVDLPGQVEALAEFKKEFLDHDEQIG